MFRILNCLLLSITFSATLFAGPKITWAYHSPKNNICKKYCVRKILGNCVEWGEHCDYRTKNPWLNSNKALIHNAMNLLSDRINTRQIETCIHSNVRLYRGSYAPSGEKKEQAWIDFSALQKAGKWPHLVLTSFRENNDVVAQAYLQRNAWGTKTTLKWNGDLQIEVNLTKMDNMIRQNGSFATEEDYAGSLLHELLHQMAHDHPSTGNYSEDYEKGHFVVVAGDCVTSNGVGARNTGLGLTGGRRWPMPK